MELLTASVEPTAANNLNDEKTAPSDTLYNGNNLSGFTASISVNRYAVNVLNSSILNSGSIPEDYQMNIPANTTSYTISINGASLINVPYSLFISNYKSKIKDFRFELYSLFTKLKTLN